MGKTLLFLKMDLMLDFVSLSLMPIDLLMQEAEEVRKRLEEKVKQLQELEEKLNAREKVSTPIQLMIRYPNMLLYQTFFFLDINVFVYFGLCILV